MLLFAELARADHVQHGDAGNGRHGGHHMVPIAFVVRSESGRQSSQVQEVAGNPGPDPRDRPAIRQDAHSRADLPDAVQAHELALVLHPQPAGDLLRRDQLGQTQADAEPSQTTRERFSVVDPALRCQVPSGGFSGGSYAAFHSGLKGPFPCREDRIVHTCSLLKTAAIPACIRRIGGGGGAHKTCHVSARKPGCVRSGRALVA